MPQCKGCGESNVYWVQEPAGWRLYDCETRELHKCPARMPKNSPVVTTLKSYYCCPNCNIVSSPQELIEIKAASREEAMNKVNDRVYSKNKDAIDKMDIDNNDLPF